jgi:hypothetical protein
MEQEIRFNWDLIGFYRGDSIRYLPPTPTNKSNLYSINQPIQKPIKPRNSRLKS